MKNFRLTTGIVLIALATAAAGQKSTFKERIFPSINQEVIFVNADYNSRHSGMDMLADHFLNWFSPRDQQTYLELPEAVMTFHFTRAEVIYETEPFVESWMSLPFENEVAEEVLEPEPWMSEAFDNELNEYGPPLEVWMSRSFEESLFEEVVLVEGWMGEPFEKELSEEPLLIEEWMLAPFEIEEELETEGWMADSCT